MRRLRDVLEVVASRTGNAITILAAAHISNAGITEPIVTVASYARIASTSIILCTSSARKKALHDAGQ